MKQDDYSKKTTMNLGVLHFLCKNVAFVFNTNPFLSSFCLSFYVDKMGMV